MEGKNMYVGAKKNPDGSFDLSTAASFMPKEKSSKLSPEQKQIATENKNRNEAFFKALAKGGGTETQEARMELDNLKEKLKMFKDSNPEDHETIAHYENEIALNQRVANGEKSIDVLNSMQSEKDKKRIAEEREKIKNMKQL